MYATVHWFARLLRARGVRVSVAEIVDAVRCVALPGVPADRESLRRALRATLIKNHPDEPVFTELFDLFFALVRIGPPERDRTAIGDERSSVDELPAHTGDLDAVTLAATSEAAAQSEGAAPEDVRHLFDTDELASRVNLSQDEGMIDLSTPTDEIAFSRGNQAGGPEGYRLQLDAERLRTPSAPGALTAGEGSSVDVRLTLDQQEALLDWLGAPPDDDGADGQWARVLGDLPEALRRHAEALLALGRDARRAHRRVASVRATNAAERAELEEALRRIAASLRGAPTHRRRPEIAGRIDAARTMRRSMRFDGVPFAPVTVRRSEHRPRLVVLADVSLSVRATAHFTLHLVHTLQEMFARVQTFAFVADVAETTGLFAEHGAERALGEVFGGDLLDLDADSDYGAVFTAFGRDWPGALDRKTTLLVLGDGRGNGKDPALAEFAGLTRRARETIWLTPEPRYSWGLGGCDLPAYAEYCSRVHVVRGLRELARTADAFGAEAGR